MNAWSQNPHSGGCKIPETVKKRTTERIQKHAQKHYAGQFERLEVRYRGALCYIDAYTEPDEPTSDLLKVLKETHEEFMARLRSTPTHLCRLRYFGNEEAWSMAFYTYSDEKYEPCYFQNGTFYGTPEEAFDISSGYLDD